MPRPSWLRVKTEHTALSAKVQGILAKYSLNTVCSSAKCPNSHECWSKGTAAFMLLGKECARNCRFCAIRASRRPKRPDREEPYNLARAVRDLGLKYVVLTSVDRSDLKDHGAGHFADCIELVKSANPGVMVEALVPDFNGSVAALRKIVNAHPTVISHNIETVERLYPLVRDRRADYGRSLEVLLNVKRLNPLAVTKSSLMVGFREKEMEVYATMRHLRKSGVRMLTIGQYLQPTKRNLRVLEYVEPEKFERYEVMAYGLGFDHVAAGPLVRGSYRAEKPFLR